RNDELLDDLEALGQLLGLQLGGRLGDFHTQVSRDLFEIEVEQDVANGFSADLGGEAVGTVFVLGVEELLFGQKFVLGERAQTGIENDVVFEVENALDILERHVEQQGDAARQRLQEPDVGNGRGQFDVAHALATNAAQGDFNTA